MKSNVYYVSLLKSSAHFAAAQLYHNLHQYEKAYAQYRLASNHPQLQRTKIGRISRLMVARYILSYIAGSPSLDKATIIQQDTESMSMEYTKVDAFKMLENLAVLDRFESSFYWLGKLRKNSCIFELRQRKLNFFFLFSRLLLYWERNIHQLS